MIIRRLLIALGVVFATSSVGNAGMDDTHRIISMKGIIWVRHATLRYGVPGPKWHKNPRFGPWERLRSDKQIGPVCEIRTEAKSTLTLQTGDQIDDLSQFPDDSKVHYTTLAPRSSVRLNSQYDATHPRLEQTIYGKVEHKWVKGRKPAAQH